MSLISKKWILPHCIDNTLIDNSSAFTFNGVTTNDLLQVNADASITGNLNVDGTVQVPVLISTADATFNGPLTVIGLLTAHNDASIVGLLSVMGDASVTDTLRVDDLRVLRDATVGRGLNVDGNLTVDGTTFLNGDQTLSGSLSVSDDVSIGDDLFVGDDFFVGDDATINGNLRVDGTVSVGPGTVLVDGTGIRASGNLYVSAPRTDFTGTLVSNDTFRVIDDATVGKTLDVDGAFRANAAATVTGVLTANGILNANNTLNSATILNANGQLRAKDTTFSGSRVLVNSIIFTNNSLYNVGGIYTDTLDATTASVSGALDSGSFFTPSAILDTLTVNGDATVSGDFRVESPSTLYGNNAIFSSTLSASSITTSAGITAGGTIAGNNLNSTVDLNVGVDGVIGNDLNVGNNLDVGNELEVTGTLTALGPLVANNSLSVTGPLTTASDITSNRDILGNVSTASNLGSSTQPFNRLYLKTNGSISFNSGLNISNRTGGLSAFVDASDLSVLGRIGAGSPGGGLFIPEVRLDVREDQSSATVISSTIRNYNTNALNRNYLLVGQKIGASFHDAAIVAEANKVHLGYNDPYNPSTGGAYIALHSNADYALELRGDTTNTGNFRVAGNLGIGTVSSFYPTIKLDVREDQTGTRDVISATIANLNIADASTNSLLVRQQFFPGVYVDAYVMADQQNFKTYFSYGNPFADNAFIGLGAKSGDNIPAEINTTSFHLANYKSEFTGVTSTITSGGGMLNLDFTCGTSYNSGLIEASVVGIFNNDNNKLCGKVQKGTFSLVNGVLTDSTFVNDSTYGVESGSINFSLSSSGSDKLRVILTNGSFVEDFVGSYHIEFKCITNSRMRRYGFNF